MNETNNTIIYMCIFYDSYLSDVNLFKNKKNTSLKTFHLVSQLGLKLKKKNCRVKKITCHSGKKNTDRYLNAFKHPLETYVLHAFKRTSGFTRPTGRRTLYWLMARPIINLPEFIPASEITRLMEATINYQIKYSLLKNNFVLFVLYFCILNWLNCIYNCLNWYFNILLKKSKGFNIKSQRGLLSKGFSIYFFTQPMVAI